MGKKHRGFCTSSESEIFHFQIFNTDESPFQNSKESVAMLVLGLSKFDGVGPKRRNKTSLGQMLQARVQL